MDGGFLFGRGSVHQTSISSGHRQKQPEMLTVGSREPVGFAESHLWPACNICHFSQTVPKQGGGHLHSPSTQKKKEGFWWGGMLPPSAAAAGRWKPFLITSAAVE